MNETHPRHTGRSIGAVVAGIFVGIILSLGTDALLHVIGIFPQLGQTMSDRLFMLATAYRTVYSVIGSYLIARLAPDRPMRHALAGGVVGIVLCLVGAIATWNREPSLGPHWYPLALIVTALPCAWLGGKLRERQLSEPQAL
jgi:hypothetical protein